MYDFKGSLVRKLSIGGAKPCFERRLRIDLGIIFFMESLRILLVKPAPTFALLGKARQNSTILQSKKGDRTSML